MTTTSSPVIPHPETWKQNDKLKTISYDEDTGKLMLYTTDNLSFECNIFGKPKPKFTPDVTGMPNSTYLNRLNNQTIEPLSKYPDQISGGYFQHLPRSYPFINFPNKISQQMIKELKADTTRISWTKNKELLNRKASWDIVHVVSGNRIPDEKSIDKILNVINTTLKEYKAECDKYGSKNFTKREIKAWKKLATIWTVNNNNIKNKHQLSVFSGRAVKRNNSMYDNQQVMRVNNNVEKRKKKELSCSQIIDHAKLSKYNIESFPFMVTKSSDRQERIVNQKKLVENSNREKQGLVGFQKKVEKERGIFRKAKLKLPSRGDEYTKELQLLYKVNKPMVIQEKQKTIKDRIFFDKKRKRDIEKIERNFKRMNMSMMD